MHKAARTLLNVMRLDVALGLALFAWVLWLEFG